MTAFWIAAGMGAFVVVFALGFFFGEHVGESGPRADHDAARRLSVCDDATLLETR